MGIMGRVDFGTYVKVSGQEKYSMTEDFDNIKKQPHGVEIRSKVGVVFVPYQNVRAITYWNEGV